MPFSSLFVAWTSWKAYLQVFMNNILFSFFFERSKRSVHDFLVSFELTEVFCLGCWLCLSCFAVFLLPGNFCRN